MYSLIVLGSDDQWEGKWITFSRGRFLEHTHADIKARLEDLSPVAISDLTSYPAIFTSEGSDETVGRIGRITQIRVRHAEIGFTREINDELPPITWGMLRRLGWDLDVSAVENSRTHWAVKDADLFKVLQGEGLLQDASNVSSAAPALTKPTRAELLSASRDLEQLGHSDFDRFLLEIGIDELDAGRSIGSLQARGNALAKFALAHEGIRTAEGQDLWLAILSRATRLRQDRPMAFTNERDGPPRAWLESEASTPAVEHQAKVASTPVQQEAAAMNKVFLVHGRDDGLKEQVARFLEKLGLDVTILHERPNKGRTLISKFREESSDISFAVVLMTADDEGALKGEEIKERARQNVVFELGFFIGKLGADRVCALVKGAVEKPSDFDAVVYVGVDAAGAWKSELARELKEAGLKFDHSKVFS